MSFRLTIQNSLEKSNQLKKINACQEKQTLNQRWFLPVWTVRSELHTKANTLWQHGVKYKNKTPQPTRKFSFSQDHVILLTRSFRISWKRKKKKPNCSQFIKSWGSETMEYIRGLSKTVLYCAIMRSYIHHFIFIFPGYITNQFNNQFLFGFLAQLVSALHRYRRGQGSNPNAWNCSGFFASSKPSTQVA